MIRTRSMFLTISFVSIFAVVLVLLAANSIPASAVLPTRPSSDAGDVTAEQVEVQAGDSTPNPITTEPAASQVVPLSDAPLLIANHCSRCHTEESLKEIKKTPAEWEEALAMMKWMGVRLTDAERITLIEYLAVPNGE